MAQPVGGESGAQRRGRPEDFLVVHRLAGVQQVQQNSVHLTGVALALVGRPIRNDALGQGKPRTLQLADLGG